MMTNSNGFVDHFNNNTNNIQYHDYDIVYIVMMAHLVLKKHAKFTGLVVLDLHKSHENHIIKRFKGT